MQTIVFSWVFFSFPCYNCNEATDNAVVRKHAALACVLKFSNRET